VGRGIWKGQLAFGTGEYKAEESRVGRFSGKIAIVSGAASGMGEMEARIIADEGGKVVLTDVQSALGERVAADIGSSAVFRQHDVADERGWAEVVQLARDTFGPPTVLINNGGVGAYGGIHEIETEYMRRIMEINFMGSFFGIRAVLPSMREMGGGAIVNISSGLATTSLAGYFPVGTSKWAVRGMTRLAAKDLAPFNIRVNTVFPGAIDTPSLVQEVRDNAKSLIPLGRAGGSDECARVVTFLASDEASYVSGAEVMVDGAMLC
jgi:3alpha(or 20beta)-hydroxysteroid dehydrogenase